MIYKEYHNAYFIGIGGIGMSALARHFNNLGINVFGFDRTKTALTEKLTEEGISIHYEDDVDNISWIVKEEINKTLVVYTAAIPADNHQLEFFRAKGYVVRKRAEVLGWITEGVFTIAVAGTHGKTTTSSMLAHILKEAGENVEGFIGGLTVNYDSNYITSENNVKDLVIVVEADEYDRSFLTLNPDIAILTSVDADHLDIYHSKDALQSSFHDFVNKITEQGRLIAHDNLRHQFNENNFNTKIDYYGNNRGQFFASNISMKNGFFIFDLYAENSVIRDVTLGVPGFYNLENALAAAGAASRYGVKLELIKRALSSYKGVKRRFEFVLNQKGKVFIDDYAHHPEEIRSFLSSVREIYPKKKLTAIFQPHLYSRTRDFSEEFAESLNLCDNIYLLDIYPARELPIPGVTSEVIRKNLKVPNKLIKKGDLLTSIELDDVEVLVTIGAGDIDTLVKPLRNLLLKQ